MAPAELSTDPGPVTEDEDGRHGVSRIRPGRPTYVRWRQRLRPEGVHPVHGGGAASRKSMSPCPTHMSSEETTGVGWGPVLAPWRKGSIV